MALAFSTEKVGWTYTINGQVTVWSWGANSYGQLGHGHCDDQLLPKIIEAVKGQDVRTITGGGGHTFVMTNDGLIQGCGSNNKGQLGHGHLTDVNVLTTVPRFASGRVIQVAAGWDFSLAITDDRSNVMQIMEAVYDRMGNTVGNGGNADQGEVFSFGSNAFGQLGDSTLPQKCSTPSKIKIPNREHVVQAAAGLRHSVVLSANGSVYCWGHAKKGQCGNTGDEKQTLKISTPQKILVPEEIGRICQVVAGSFHTVALSESGKLLVWGCNKNGQTTLNPQTAVQVNTPFIIPQESFNGRKVTVIRSGWTHLVAQTDSGQLYSWGRCDYGQLGRTLPEGSLFSHMPDLIETTENIVDFQCGSEHTLFLSDKRKCYAVGWNEHGLCGTGDEENVMRLRLVEILNDHHVIKIGCGGGHCFALTTNLQESAK